VLDYPEPNSFIPADFTMLGEGKWDSLPAYPHKIRDEHNSVVWFKQDQRFKKPVSLLACTIYSNDNNIYHSIASSLYQRIYCYMLDKKLKSLSYMANTAKLNYSFTSKEYGIGVSIQGFSSSISGLFTALFKELNSAVDKMDDEELFAILKEDTQNELESIILGPPYSQAIR
jgi:secreted Zn-dependent insulinase-like peptidase